MNAETRETGDGEPEVKTSVSEHDLQPEYCHYRDEGCEYAASCLDCPYPQCLYDMPRGRQHWLKERRNREILRFFHSGGWGVRELASEFAVSQRTVQRALKSTLARAISSGGRGEVCKGEREEDE